jgi:flagellar hook-associated protein 2
MSESLRITGMSSGLDTENMVKQMMKPYNIKIDKMKQDKQVIQWKQELYRDIMKDILDLRSSFMNVSSSDSNILSANTYASYDAGVTSGAGTLNISTSATAVAGDYSITVSNLADKARFEGNQLLVNGVQATANTKLSELDINKTKNITGSILQIKLGTDAPVEVSITADKTIGDVIKEINTGLNGKVTARFSELSGSIIVQSVSTGENINLTMSSVQDATASPAPDVTALQALGIISGTTTSITAMGKDALLNITPPGGSEVTGIKKSTNSFSIDGVGYSLLKEGSATFSVTPSEQKTFDKIKGFIDKYNSLVEKIQTKLTEKRQYSYQPLTEEQKKDMKEDEIKDWEEKAKQGLLKGDATLQNLLSDLRRAFTTPVASTQYSFGNRGDKSIGLDTTSSYTDGGKIVITDEMKLKQAIRNNPVDIMNLFTNVSLNTNETTKYSETGIFRRIESVIKDNLGPIGVLKGTLLNKVGYIGSTSEFTNILSGQIIEREKRIAAFQNSLYGKEDRYYRQFASLEKYMNQMNSQSAWLSQQLSGGI